MNLFMILSFLFSIGSFLGWILEAVYRRFISDSNPERKWINPGALIGPCLPLYGVSLILLYLLARLELYLPIGEPALCKAVLFIAMAICITVVEYITGLIFIVKFKMRLWDYSQNRFNIKGIICPLYSFFWMILSAVYYFFIDPHILKALNWLAENLAFSFFIGFFYGIFAVDVFISARDWLKISDFAKDNKIIVRLEELKCQIRSFKDQQKESLRFILALRSSANIREHLQRYKEKLSAIGISRAKK